MREIRREEKVAVVTTRNMQEPLAAFIPQIKQTIITTQRLNGRIVCRIERKVKFMKKGGESDE